MKNHFQYMGGKDKVLENFYFRVIRYEVKKLLKN